MAYNEKLAEKIRISLNGVRNVKEKKMFGGIAFMVNDKMCVGVDKDDLIFRCEPEQTDELLAKKGARIFNLTGKPMKGWLLIGPEATSGKKNLDYWITLALESNRKVKASKKSKVASK
jgi:TfoX/Sxy family transcriptional regulator of competence genes